MSPGLRQLDIAEPDAVYPVEVQVSVTGAGPRARVARAPLMYSCRVFSPAGAGADQMLRAVSTRCHPVIGTPPLMTGRAPEAAVQITLWPPVPESAAVRVSVLASWYTPLASSTRMSPVMFWLSPRTSCWARPSVRTGWLLDVPALASLPEGETKTVARTAAPAGTEPARPSCHTSTAASAAANEIG